VRKNIPDRPVTNCVREMHLFRGQPGDGVKQIGTRCVQFIEKVFFVHTVWMIA
jgi:hypothetical protein